MAEASCCIRALGIHAFRELMFVSGFLQMCSQNIDLPSLQSKLRIAPLMIEHPTPSLPPAIDLGSYYQRSQSALLHQSIGQIQLRRFLFQVEAKVSKE
jgi:hypothetical protein